MNRIKKFNEEFSTAELAEYGHKYGTNPPPKIKKNTYNEPWRILINAAFNNLRWKLKSKTNKEIEEKLQEMESLVNKLISDFEEKYLNESLSENRKSKWSKHSNSNSDKEEIIRKQKQRIEELEKELKQKDCNHHWVDLEYKDDRHTWYRCSKCGEEKTEWS